MNLKEWDKKYSKILKEFNYSRKKDKDSALLLNSIIKTKFPLKKLEKKIKNQTVFVIGAGSSLVSWLDTIRKYPNVTKIVADGATTALIENRIKPDVIVTDLDGDIDSLKKASNNGSMMIVHSHGDNVEKLHLASEFKYCIGTTEGKPFGKIHNFGGFTDGDRCVFLSKRFGAKKIILIGMDFGTKIGKYSKKKIPNKAIKIKKLKFAKQLLEWLALDNKSQLYTTKPIRGFTKLNKNNLAKIVL